MPLARRKSFSASLVILLIALSGCSTGNDGQSVAVPTTESRDTAVGATATTSASPPFVPAGYDSIVTSDGRTRTYRVVDLVGGASVPLVLVLHGFGGDAEGLRAIGDIERIVSENLVDGAVVVYPNGTGADEGLPQSWNAGGCCPFSTFALVDDVGFVDRLIDTLTDSYPIDPERIWVVGYSNGGMMAYRLACELSSKIAAIGVAAGSMMVDECPASSSVSVLHLHGDLDAVVPLMGGTVAGITFPSADQSIGALAAANGCTPQEDGICASERGVASVRLVTNPTWGHEWQSEWSALFAEFFAGLPKRN